MQNNKFSVVFLSIIFCHNTNFDCIKISLCYFLNPHCLPIYGHADAQLVEALRYKPEGCGFDSQLWPRYGPEVDSASNRNEYQEYFLGAKAGGA